MKSIGQIDSFDPQDRLLSTLEIVHPSLDHQLWPKDRLCSSQIVCFHPFQDRRLWHQSIVRYWPDLTRVKIDGSKHSMWTFLKNKIIWYRNEKKVDTNQNLTTFWDKTRRSVELGLECNKEMQLTHIGKLSGNDSGNFPETFQKRF